MSGARPIRLVDAGTRKELDLRVVVPVEDMREPGAGAVQTDPLLGTGAEGVAATSIWPSIYPALLKLSNTLNEARQEQNPISRARACRTIPDIAVGGTDR